MIRQQHPKSNKLTNTRLNKMMRGSRVGNKPCLWMLPTPG